MSAIAPACPTSYIHAVAGTAPCIAHAAEERQLLAVYIPANLCLCSRSATVIFWVSVAYIFRTVSLGRFYFQLNVNPYLNTVKTLIIFYCIKLVAAVSR